MQNPRLGLGYFWTGILKHTHLNSTPSPEKFLKQSRRSFIQLHQKPGNFLHSAKQYHINPESLQFCRNMHQTKIGQFFKRKPAAGDEAESPDKKVPPPKVLPTKPKVEKNGSSSVKKEKATAAESPPARKRKSRNSDESGSEEEETAKKLKTKPKAENGNKKARRRIVVESSSEEEEDATEAMSDEENGKEEAGSSASTEAGSPSPSPEKKKSPVQEKPKEKSKPAAKSTKAKATPAKKASPAAAKAKKTSPATAKKPAVPVKKEGKASKPEENSDEDAPNKDNDASTDEKSPAPATPVKKPPAVAVAGWDNEYNPGKAKYDPIEDASWQRGQKVPYLALAKTLEAIEATSSRLKNIEILANYFRSVIVLTPNDLVHSVYLCLNKLAPAYEGVELGIAETNIMKAIAQATGRALDRIKADAAAQGDLGLVAESSRSTQKTLFQSPPLTVTGVFHKLKEIASISGNASQGKKVSMITSMLVACKHSEARYLTRSLAGKLRIGLAEQSLLQALAQACFLTPPDQDMSVWPPKVLNAGKKLSPETLKARIDEEAYKLKSCFCECPNYEMLVNAIIKDGTNNLAEHCKLTPGIPPRPMLAQPTKGVADVLERFEGIKFTCEYKYDGERAQVHLLEDGSVRIYSRNQEDNTSKYPDIVSRFQSCIKGDVKSCILDSEAVAWDAENETILPFQVLSTRKRKDANESEIKVQVQLFAFDLIYLNGEALVKEPFLRRRQLLQENFQEIKGQFMFATKLDTDSMEEVQEFLEESIKGNCEGLMVKTLDVNASYELAKRSQKWLKLKKDYLDSGGDSLDLVVIGGFFGKGKRTGNYGGYLLACYNPEEEVYQTICKLGTGFSDEQLAQHSETLKPHIIPSAKSYYSYHQQLTPDHWFDAVQVWEVKCADLSLSPVHMAAAGIADPLRGISLRFPRFLRIRDDKGAEDATSSSQVADLYRNQEQVKNSTQAPKDDEDDFY